MNKNLNLDSKEGEDFVNTVKGAVLDALLSEDRIEAKAELKRKETIAYIQEKQDENKEMIADLHRKYGDD